ncbi:hypothetical protein BC940DRAFT_115285 [Gongronella butleri]|nr:hypothetical protein BC940DRAFT_115285 [Gongronella butleri]
MLQNSYQIPSPPRRQPSPTSPHGATQTPWRSRLFNTLNLKKKKIMTVSVKNTILWNPSQDVELPNHAFHENAVALMMRLCAQYEVHFLVQSNTDEERDQLHALLLPLRRLVDPSRVVYCSDAVTKQRIVRAISPDVHVEGGWELDDGEDMVRALRDNVDKIVWIITRRRRTSFNKHNIQQKDQDILTPNVELTDAFLDTTLAEQVGFVVDN